MSFEHLGLRTELLRAVSARGYTIPTPIQAQAIPAVLKGRDVLAGAQTGTGKTAAYALPMLQLLSSRGGKSRNPRALVLTPTRELAAQVAEFVEDYGKNLRLSSAVVFGGVPMNPQFRRLRQRVDVLVATPGRLLDHLQQGTVDLSNVEVLVLDEADRMLDMGFIRDIRKDLGAENLPFVIAETGMHGPTETHPRALSLMAAQAAVAKYDEFKGNVAFVGTKAFYRPKEESPSGQGYHWNSNAETYFLIGDAMGKAMKKLCKIPERPAGR